jgi:hypothetical protein
MELSTSWEAVGCLSNQKFLLHLCNPEDEYCLYKNLSFDFMLSQMNPAYTFILYMHVNDSWFLPCVAVAPLLAYEESWYYILSVLEFERKMALSCWNKCDGRRIRGKEGRRWIYICVCVCVCTEERGEETFLMCRSGRWSGKRNDDSTDKE